MYKVIRDQKVRIVEREGDLRLCDILTKEEKDLFLNLKLIAQGENGGSIIDIASSIVPNETITLFEVRDGGYSKEECIEIGRDWPECMACGHYHAACSCGEFLCGGGCAEECGCYAYEMPENLEE